MHGNLNGVVRPVAVARLSRVVEMIPASRWPYPQQWHTPPGHDRFSGWFCARAAVQTCLLSLLLHRSRLCVMPILNRICWLASSPSATRDGTDTRRCSLPSSLAPCPPHLTPAHGSVPTGSTSSSLTYFYCLISCLHSERVSTPTELCLDSHTTWRRLRNAVDLFDTRHSHEC